MNAEIVTVDGEVVDPPQTAITLFGTDNPVTVVERATTIATALADVIDSRQLFTLIGQKKHTQVEGWTLLGSMLGVFAEIEWSRPLENGWEARAVARTLNGNLVGAAESMCTTDEPRWKSAGQYAVRSMAQTRAVSKALRMPLGFIMHLAGYSATPAEELNDEPEQGAGPSRTAGAPADPVPAPATTAANRAAWAAAYGWTVEAVEQAALDATNTPLGELDHDGWKLFAAAVVKGGPGLPPDKQGVGLESGTDSTGTPTPDGPEAGAASSPGVASATVPPKPGTKEYRELADGGARADARAYWQRPLEVTA